MLPRSFYFLRHGETDWNLEQRLQGHTDVPLNETGRRQAAEVVGILKNHPIDCIVASSLARAYETAQIVNKTLKKPILLEEDLRERNFGIMEGRTIAEIEEFRQIMNLDSAPLEENGHPCAPQAETYVDFKHRITLAINRHLHDYAGQNILFVSHGGVFRVLSRGMFGKEDQSLNGQPMHFDKRGESWLLNILS